VFSYQLIKPSSKLPIFKPRCLGSSARKKAFNKISAKHFDFLLCDREELSVACAIELDDVSQFQAPAGKGRIP
jgi:hypothetical protein